jgi:hypothetical protein
VGRSKVHTLKDYFHRILPECEVEALQVFFTRDLAPQLLYILFPPRGSNCALCFVLFCFILTIWRACWVGGGRAGNPTFVLDCIDNRDTKVELIAYCKNNDIPVRLARTHMRTHRPH